MTSEDPISRTESTASVAGSSVAVTEAAEDALDNTFGSSVTSTTNKVFLTKDSSLDLALPSVDEDALSNTDSSFAVAGSSVANTEAEEDEAASLATGGASIPGSNKVVVTKESSLDISIVAAKDEEEQEEDAAPMHLHVLRTPARLRGAPGARSRSSSRSRPGSRRSSLSPTRSLEGGIVGPGSPTGGKVIASDASVSSSLDGEGGRDSIVDPDILLDKLGFRDLDPNASQAELRELLMKHLSSNTGLPTLNERMTEDALDDVHAFQDLTFVKKPSDGSTRSLKSVKSAKMGSPGEGGGEGPIDEAEDSPSKFSNKDLLLAAQSSGLSSSTKAILANQNFQLSILDEAVEEEEEEEEEDAENEDDNEDNNEEDNDRQISPASSISGDDENDEAADGIVGGNSSPDKSIGGKAEIVIPDEAMEELNVSESGRGRNRDTTFAIAGIESLSDEGDDHDKR